ncbi:MAG: NADH-quinone oxidoreductase subunit N [Coriobacteriia bacterium]|nr:NADH-quinone oxidoreductase subunit N [Coriobacteriia bacterium]
MGGTAQAVAYLWPELIVAITGALILVIDLFLPRVGEEGASSRSWLAYVGVAGLAVAAVATAARAGVETTLFDGIIVLDGLATYFTFLFLGIGALSLLLAANSVPRFTRWPAEYYALVVWCTLGHMVLASAGELFTIFVTLQLTSLPLIILIGYAKRSGKSGEAALKYLLLVLVSTAVLAYGMSLIYGSLGTSTISEIALQLGKAERIDSVVALGLVLLLTGFAFKITAAPFHYWVPDTYEGAPTPTTAFMSVGSKFAGFALALRIIVATTHVQLDWPLIFGVMAALSMTIGNLGAIRQVNIKRMLAYSGIAQAGYLLVGVAALSAAGVASILFYSVAYTLANLAAFGTIINVAKATRSAEIEGYAGLAKRAPLVALTAAIALLSLGGLPLLGGFMAKFYVFLTAAHEGLIWLVAIGVINSVISMYYYMRVIYVIYVREGDTEPLVLDPSATLASAVCVAGVLALGLFPEYAFRLANEAAAVLFR